MELPVFAGRCEACGYDKHSVSYHDGAVLCLGCVNAPKLQPGEMLPGHGAQCVCADCEYEYRWLQSCQH